jgi:HK97 family phage major capsid protein
MNQEITDETEVRDQRMLTERFDRGAKVSVVAYDKDLRTVELSFASEIEVERWYGLEVLEMSPKAAELNRLNNGGALLSDHNTRQQIGRVDKAWIGDDKRAHAVVKFSRKAVAEDEFQDVIDGIRTNVSFGYRVLDYKTEVGKGNTPDKRTVTRWEAYEISLVAVPADPSVGVGRAHEDLGNPEPTKQAETTESRGAETATAENTNSRSKETMNNPENQVDQPAATVTFAREDSIMEFGRKFGAPEAMVKRIALDPNGTVDTLRTELGKQYAAVPVTLATPDEGTPASRLDMTDKEVRQYSFSRAILAQADGDWSKAGFERECHEAIEQKMSASGMTRQGAGFLVPIDVQNVRDMSATGGGASGGFLVSTDHMPQSFIELLRSKMLMLKAGVRVMSDLVGNPSIPRQDGSTTGYWVTEGVAPGKSDVTLGQLTMSPKTCGARTEFTRQLLVQSAPSIDQLVKSDIAEVLARTVDAAIINGSGTDGQPTGFLNTTGVSSIAKAGADFAWADAVAFNTAFRNSNAPGTPSWLASPTVLGTLETRPKIGTTYPVYLLENGKLNGYGIDHSTAFPASTISFGDYSTIVLGEWGILEIEANKYGSTFGAGGIEVRGLHMVDVAVRYPQALKKMTDFS